MKKLEPAIVPQSERDIIIRDLLWKWKIGNPEIRTLVGQIVASEDINVVREALTEYMAQEAAQEKVWMNDVYQVCVRSSDPKDPQRMVHLSIKRRDRKPIHDWRDLQEIKNQLVGAECEGLELYPAESRRVDTANQYHIFCFTDVKYRIPLGFNVRAISETSIGKSEQRPLK